MITLQDQEAYNIPIKFWCFPGGEEHVRITPNLLPRSITIYVDLLSSSDVMKLLLLVDAVHRLWNNVPISLICPYLPYARQDRVVNTGESLSVKVLCDLLNSCHFTKITIWDVHSDVSLALLNNATNLPSVTWVNQIIGNRHVLIAPDAGAIKKVHQCAKLHGNRVVSAEKIRDTVTGNLSGVRINAESLGEKHLLIVDDICDGGATFVNLAKELRKQGPASVSLYVTHGIFSKGLEVFKELIDVIYCPNVFPGIQGTVGSLNTNPKLVRL